MCVCVCFLFAHFLCVWLGVDLTVATAMAVKSPYNPAGVSDYGHAGVESCQNRHARNGISSQNQPFLKGLVWSNDPLSHFRNGDSVLFLRSFLHVSSFFPSPCVVHSHLFQRSFCFPISSVIFTPYIHISLFSTSAHLSALSVLFCCPQIPVLDFCVYKNNSFNQTSLEVAVI